jgi:hypothetical protein
MGSLGVAAIVSSILLWGSLPAAQVSDIGFVADVRGRWEIVRGTPPITVSAQRRLTVSEGDRLRRVNDDPASFVVIAFYTGELQKYTTTATLPALARAGLRERFMRAIQARVQDGFISAAVRGGTRVNDAVVRSDGGQTDLATVFAGAEPGPYSLTVYALDKDGAIVRPALTTARVQTSGNARVAALAPGLYQIDVADGRGQAVGNAWILSVEPDRFDEAASTMRQLSPAATERDMDLRATARALSRACLLTLNDRAVK